MPTLFEQAIARAAVLPDDEREAVGQIILDEIGDAARWEEKFARDESSLRALADEALAEYNRGATQPFDFDRMTA